MSQGFLEWIAGGVRLTGETSLYFGDPAVLSTRVGLRYLKSAYHHLINLYLSGWCHKGGFSVNDFLVADGLFLMGSIETHAISGFEDLLIDLEALGEALLVYYRLGDVAALFTDHLHYIVTNPPQAISNSLVFQANFVLLIKYHFCFASIAAIRALFCALAKARDYIGTAESPQLVSLVDHAWTVLRMDQHPVGQYWCNEAQKNPVFYSIMTSLNRRGVPQVRYSASGRSMYAFGRNDDVHAPEKTFGDMAQTVGVCTAPPQGAGHFQWERDPVHKHWDWVWKAARGLWHWPVVPVDPHWQKLWPTGTVPTFPSPLNQAYKPRIGQRMLNPDQPAMMLAKLHAMFFAHASALILIFLQPSAPEYIDQPYEVYRKLIDAEYV